MTIDTFKKFLMFAVLCVVQVLVLNQICLFGCAKPLLYVYMITTFPCTYPKWGVLLWAFALGFVIDVFSNTPGVAAASLTAVAVVQPYFLRLFVSNEMIDDVKPTLHDMGPMKYSFYIVTMVMLYCTLFCLFESFHLFDVTELIYKVLGSTLLTVVLILTIENMQKKR